MKWSSLLKRFCKFTLKKFYKININIKPIKSTLLDFTWPIAYGYADDITCVINNDSTSKSALFTEYELFTKATGLKLNADKTEIYEYGPIDINVLNVKA